MIFTFTKFHQYVYSNDVIVESDHELLGNSEEISGCRTTEITKNVATITKVLIYTPGKEMTLADTLSCAYMFPCKYPLKISCMIHMILNNAPSTDAKLEVVRKLSHS